MAIKVRAAAKEDIKRIVQVYDELCDYLNEHQNYPGWIKGIHPSEEEALQGLKEQALYVALDREIIVGSFVLRHEPEDGYQQAQWLTENDYSKIYVVYMLAVDPKYLRKGVGKALMDFAEEKAAAEKCSSIRLDVVKGNIPAEHLYRKCGFQYVDTVSLGYEQYGLPEYDLFEKVLGRQLTLK